MEEEMLQPAEQKYWRIPRECVDFVKVLNLAGFNIDNAGNIYDKDAVIIGSFVKVNNLYYVDYDFEDELIHLPSAVRLRNLLEINRIPFNESHKRQEISGKLRSLADLIDGGNS
jgi:hypothetical protein